MYTSRSICNPGDEVKQPQGLSINPESTLPERAQRWLRDNIDVLDSKDRQLNFYRPVQGMFPNGPSIEQVDILVVDSAGAKHPISSHIQSLTRRPSLGAFRSSQRYSSSSSSSYRQCVTCLTPTIFFVDLECLYKLLDRDLTDLWNGPRHPRMASRMSQESERL